MFRTAIKSVSKISVWSLFLAIMLSIGMSTSSADLTEDEYFELLAIELLMNEGYDVSQLNPDDVELVDFLYTYWDVILGLPTQENQAEVDELLDYYNEVWGL